MKHDRGTIVQVRSALGSHSIPLQPAYCGAKHAINGFTESARTELIHDNSNVHITVVQMPAVNTPQFSWVLSRLPKHPQPVPRIYQPEVAARGVLFAADRPKRKQYWVGMPTMLSTVDNKFVAPILDPYLAKTGYSSQQTSEKVPADRPFNLWEPLDVEDGHDFGAHGIFDDVARTHSPQMWFSHHARVVIVTAVGIGAAAAARAVKS